MSLPEPDLETVLQASLDRHLTGKALRRPNDESVGFTANISSVDGKTTLVMVTEIHFKKGEPVDVSFPHGWFVYARVAGLDPYGKFTEEWLAGETIRQARARGVI